MIETRNLKLALGLVAVAALAAACGKEEPKPGADAPIATEAPKAAAAPAAKAEDPKAEAEKIFKGRCVNCHGEKGAGDGPGAAALKVKPRNYTDAEWQKSVTDEDLAKIIVKGGAAVGKDAAMPPNPDLKKKKEVVDEIVKIVRTFGG